MTDEQAANDTFRVDLRFHSILGTVEQELQTALTKARQESDHGTTVGDGAEEAVRATLRRYLPSGYGVGKGIVYDAFGDGSRQTDVVITNPDHPLSFPQETSGTYRVDGVAAAGEVKSLMNVDELKNSITKGTAFKRLRMTVNESDHVVTATDQAYMQQIGMVPPYFAIAFSNKVAVETIGKRLNDAGLVEPPAGKSMGEHDWANTPQPPLDALCILGEGLWLYLRPGNPMGFQVNFKGEDGSTTTQTDAGWAFLGTDAPLVYTMIWLHAVMPRVFRGRSVFSPYLVPPVRHLKYMRDRQSRSVKGATPNDEAGPDGREPAPATEQIP